MADEFNGFFQWETADVKIMLVDQDDNPIPGILNGVKDVTASFVQGINSQHFHLEQLGVDPATSSIFVRFEQEQSAVFIKGKAEVQVNIYYDNAERDTSLKGVINIYDNLYKRIMG